MCSTVPSQHCSPLDTSGATRKDTSGATSAPRRHISPPPRGRFASDLKFISSSVYTSLHVYPSEEDSLYSSPEQTDCPAACFYKLGKDFGRKRFSTYLAMSAQNYFPKTFQVQDCTSPPLHALYSAFWRNSLSSVTTRQASGSQNLLWDACRLGRTGGTGELRVGDSRLDPLFSRNMA